MMNIQKAFKILSKDIEEIENILTGFEKSDPEEKILLQLVLSKLSNLRDNFRLMASSLPEQTVPVPQSAPEQTRNENKEISIESKLDEPTGLTGKASDMVSEPSKTNKTDEIAASTEPTKEDAHTPLKKHSDTTSPEKGKTILSDKYQHQQYRNESLAKGKKGKDLSTKLQEQPIKDIYKSIAVNERFRYVKALFKGDSNAFHQTIQTLNGTGSVEEAQQYITDHFDWDVNDELVKQLLNLVRRKLKS